MKKFIMVSPFQPEGTLGKGIYHAVDNDKLQYDKPTAFPILPVIHGYAEKGERIEVIVVVGNYKNATHNLTLFRKELEALCEDMQITWSIKELKIDYNNDLDTLLDLFGQLIEQTADEDTLYACMSYGTKPMPLVLTMALNFGHRIHRNVCFGCVVYGIRDFNTGEMQIYDITSLLYMDEIVRIMADQRVSDPVDKIKALLK